MTTFAGNSRALFDYEVLQKFTAGLELLGLEAKAIRDGKMNLRGSFVKVYGGEAFLTGAHISPHQPKNAPGEYDAARNRRLLLSKKEVEELAQAASTKGLTIVPLSVYNKGRFLKLDLAIARGKKQFDKRESIKKRDTERDLKRTL